MNISNEWFFKGLIAVRIHKIYFWALRESCLRKPKIKWFSGIFFAGENSIDIF